MLNSIQHIEHDHSIAILKPNSLKSQPLRGELLAGFSTASSALPRDNVEKNQNWCSSWIDQSISVSHRNCPSIRMGTVKKDLPVGSVQETAHIHYKSKQIAPSNSKDKTHNIALWR